jgi:hypothetical protein
MEDETEDPKNIPIYELDADTKNLVEVALNCIISLSEAQIEPDSKENLLIIADEIALRFGIPKMEIEEQLHGDEVIYRPRGGIFNDDESEAE